MDRALKKFYQCGWERMWLRYLNAEGEPTERFYSQRLTAALDLIALPRSGHLSFLDVGCGIGIYSAAVAKRFRNAQAVGVDISLPQIETAKRLVADQGLENRVSFVVADAEVMSLHQTFDGVLCCEVLEHFPEPEGLIENVIRLTKPQGQIIWSVPYCPVGGKTDSVVYRQVDEQGEVILETEHGSLLKPGYHYWSFPHAQYSYRELKGCLEKHGLTTERTILNGFLYRDVSPLRLGRSWDVLPRIARRLAEGHPTSPLVDRASNFLTGGRYATCLAVRCRRKV